MKRLAILTVSMYLMVPSTNCSIETKFSKVAAALGFGSSRTVPDTLKPCQTWLNPHTLFHGSPTMNLEVINPKPLGTRCHAQPIVFASQHIALAALFMLKHQGKFACGRLPSGDVFYLTEDTKRCIRDDHGGAIYVVSSATFFCQTQISLGLDEWISYAALRPLAKFTFPSALEAILDFGVKVYCVDSCTYAQYWRLRSDNDEWTAFFGRLSPMTKAQLALERTSN